MLELRTAAKMALVQADQDMRLRRALLRRYAGQNTPLQPGQLVFYWHDARTADFVKIRWLGTARVVMREDDEEGKPLVYSIGFRTTLSCCDVRHTMRGRIFGIMKLQTLMDLLKLGRRLPI